MSFPANVCLSLVRDRDFDWGFLAPEQEIFELGNNIETLCSTHVPRYTIYLV